MAVRHRRLLRALRLPVAIGAVVLPLFAAPGMAQDAGEPLTPDAEIGRTSVAATGVGAAAGERSASETAAGPLTLFYATNRNPERNTTRPGGFGNELRDTTLFGEVSVDADLELLADSIVIDPDAGRELADMSAMVAAATTSAVAAATEPGDEPVARFAAAAAAPATDVLVYVHGAGHSFETGVEEAARVAILYRRPGVPLVPLVFSHPSNGSSTVWGYLADRRDAGRSGAAMATAFERLVTYLAEVKGDGGRVVLAGHSLGVFALRTGVQAVAARTPPGREVFDEVFLLAGDDDADTLAADGKMRPLLPLSRRVSVYHARNDLLMFLSVIGNFRKPIGLVGPTGTDGLGPLGGKVVAVDASRFAFDGDRRGHSYHWRSPRVIADAREIFAGAAAEAVPGRTRRGPSAFALVDLGADAGLMAAADTDSPPPLVVHVRPADERGAGVLPEEALGAAFDPADPTRGFVVAVEVASLAEAEALREAARLVGDAEVLPGRADDVMTPTSTGDPSSGAFLVALPSYDYLGTILPRGIRSDGATLAPEGDPAGRLRYHVATDRVLVSGPLEEVGEADFGARSFEGDLLLAGPPGGPFGATDGTVRLTIERDGRVSGVIESADARYRVAPAPDRSTGPALRGSLALVEREAD